MAGDIHLVPLSPQAVTLLEQIHKITGKFELVFAGDAKPWKPMSENTMNAELSTIGYDTKAGICGHDFRTMACSALIEFGLWLETATERQMSDKERNNVRVAYSHKAEVLEEPRMIRTHEDHVTPREFAKQLGENVTRIRSANWAK
jgi:integrase